jgi:hypothetical protein
MIGVLELRERAREWSLREDIVEKDYVLVSVNGYIAVILFVAALAGRFA